MCVTYVVTGAMSTETQSATERKDEMKQRHKETAADVVPLKSETLHRRGMGRQLLG
jgi:hypothetical protein